MSKKVGVVCAIVVVALVVLFVINLRRPEPYQSLLFESYFLFSARELRDKTVPRIIYVAWLSDTEMSSNRKNSLAKLRSSAEVPVRLLLKENWKDVEVPSHPFHPSYHHLSDLMKSDYLRAYLMHFHGGAYTDLKPFEERSWQGAFYDLETSTAYGNGVPERKGWAAVPPDFGSANTLKIREDAQSLLITNCAFIFRAQTPFTFAWLSAQERRLDAHAAVLQSTPRGGPRDPRPLRLEELQGEIFHPLVHEAQLISAGRAFLRTVPSFSTSNYL